MQGKSFAFLNESVGTKVKVSVSLEVGKLKQNLKSGVIEFDL